MKTIHTFPAFFLIAVLLTGGCKKENIDSGSLAAKLYVANESSENITVIDATTNQFAKVIKVSDGSGDMLMTHNIQAAPDGKTIWATVNSMGAGPDKVVVIDPLTDEISHWIDIGTDFGLAHVVLDSTSDFAYATATDTNLVIEIDAHSFTVTRTFWLGAHHEPHGLRYSRGKLYISNLESNSMSILTVTDGSVVDIPVGGMAVQTAIIPNGQYVFCSIYTTRQVARYEVATGTVTHYNLPGYAQGPIQMYPTPDGTQLYICDQGVLLGRPASDKVFVMNVSNGTLITEITAGDGAHGVVVSLDGTRAYVTNKEDHSVSVINTADYSIVCTIPVGANPNGISYWTKDKAQP